MPQDFKKEWLQKSEIDYFSPFISLWLACNSWYQSHYSELNGTDRDFINNIKSDNSGRNHLFINFDRLIEDVSKQGIAFRTDLEMLHYALDKASLQPRNINSCSFRGAVVNYNEKEKTKDLLRNPKINKDGSVNANDAQDVLLLDTIYVTSNKSDLFAGIIEIIYQVRNMLVHGKLNPDEDEHDVVRFCYLILWQLME